MSLSRLATMIMVLLLISSIGVCPVAANAIIQTEQKSSEATISDVHISVSKSKALSHWDDLIFFQLARECVLDDDCWVCLDTVLKQKVRMSIDKSTDNINLEDWRDDYSKRWKKKSQVDKEFLIKGVLKASYDNDKNTKQFHMRMSFIPTNIHAYGKNLVLCGDNQQRAIQLIDTTISLESPSDNERNLIDKIAYIVDKGRETQANDIGILVDTATISLSIVTTIGGAATAVTGIGGALCIVGMAGTAVSVKNLADKVSMNSELKSKIAAKSWEVMDDVK